MGRNDLAVAGEKRRKKPRRTDYGAVDARMDQEAAEAEREAERQRAEEDLRYDQSGQKLLGRAHARHEKFRTMNENNAQGEDPGQIESCGDHCRHHWCFFVMLVVLIGVFAGIIIAFALVASQHFTYHRECVTCFDTDPLPHTVAPSTRPPPPAPPALLGAATTATAMNRGYPYFNQTAGVCCFGNGSYSYEQQQQQKQQCSLSPTRPASPSDSVVTRAPFCGAPHCAMLQLMPGLRSAPYVMMLLSAVIGVATSAIINLVKEHIARPLWKRYFNCRYCAYKDVTRDYISADARDIAQVLGIFGSMDPVLYVFLYLYALVHLFILIGSVNKHSLGELRDDAWQRYEFVYLQWLNSGTVEVMFIAACQAFTVSAADSIFHDATSGFLPEDQEKLGLQAGAQGGKLRQIIYPLAPWVSLAHQWKIHFLLLPLPLLPIIITHVLPAAVVFIPVTLLFGVAVFTSGLLILYLGPRIARHFPHAAQISFILIGRTTGQFLVVSFFQMMASYAVVFYSGKSWPATIRAEFNSRDLLCYGNAFVNEVQSATLGVIGLILA